MALSLAIPRAAAAALPATALLSRGWAVIAVRHLAVPAGGSSAGGSGGSTLSGTAKAKLEKEKRARRRRSKNLTFKEALRLSRAHATARFDETVDVQIQLAVDPRKPNQNIRGIAQLPAGTGKAVNVAVFARGEKAEEARRAGATVVGAEDLVERIAAGDVPFTKIIATPDVMALVGRVARVLGPRGLMPNPKLGTVTMAVKEAVAAARRGQAEFRVEKRGIVMAGVGKVSFPVSDLRDNVRALMLAIGDQRPEGLKGTFIRWAFVRSTMGPAIPLDVAVIDPTSARFMEAAPAVGAAAAAAPATRPAGASAALPTVAASAAERAPSAALA